jgi:U3 small nucleolar ribonucleoprotein protein IMP4
MSLRNVFLKAKEMDKVQVAVVSERDGNPNGIEFYQDEKPFMHLQLTVDFSPPQGRVNKDKIHLRCEVDELTPLVTKIFNLPLEEPGKQSDENLALLRSSAKKSIPVMEFFDKNGQATGPRIYLQEWQQKGDDDT